MCLGTWRFPSASGGLHPRLLPPFEGGWVNCPAPEAPLTRGMPTGPRAFLANSGRVWATALRPVPPKKGLVPYMPVRWGVHQIPQINIGLHLSRCRVALRPSMLSAARIWPNVSQYLEISFGLRWPSPPGFYPLRGWGVHRPAPEGNADGAVGIFGNAGRMSAPALCLYPLTKRPCATHACWVGRSSNTTDQYRCYPNSTRFLPFLCNSIFLV